MQDGGWLPFGFGFAAQLGLQKSFFAKFLT